MGTVYRAAQLADLGIGRRQRDALVREGRLHRVEHGVYCTERAEGELLLKAVAVTRPHLVFAGATARQIYDGKTITTPLKGQVARPNTYQNTPLLTVTQVRALPHRTVDGHRVVTPLAAIRDLLDTDTSAARAFLEKHYAGREGNATLAADLRQCPRVPVALRDIIAMSSIASDSASERTLARALKRALKDRGVTVIQNHKLGFYHWDYAIPEARIVVDLDSFRYHAALASGDNESTFIIDRWKANDGARRGWLVLHYTGECVYRHADKVIEQIVDTVVWRLNGGGPSSDILPQRLSFEDTSVFRWHFTLRAGGTAGW